MMRMQDPLRSFGLTLVGVWAVLSIAGYFYAQLLSIPASLFPALIAAFLWEASFYLLPGFEGVRRRIEYRWTPRRIALFLAASAVIPYCAYSLPAGLFQWSSLVMLAVLALTASFWYLLLPRHWLTDAAFLAFFAAVFLAKHFPAIYESPWPRAHMEILGRLMWIRLGVTVMLSLRGAEGIGFGFLPARSEWITGLRHYLYFLPAGFILSAGLDFARFEPRPVAWWQILGTFLGMLWVVALAEEFFFRGLVQQWLSRALSPTLGLVLASLLFGLAHLPFRAFPNWRFALIAAVAGLFYGRAYAKSGGIRAAMVAHALVNTTWRFLFA